MRLRTKILAALALFGVVPVALLGWFSFSAHREELRAAAGKSETRAALDLARAVEEALAGDLSALSLAAGYLPADDMTPRELSQVLALPYRQTEDAPAVAAVSR